MEQVTAHPVADAIEQKSTELLTSVEETGTALQQYHTALATEERLDEAGVEALHAGVREEVESLRRTATNLRKAYSDTLSITDELDGRLHDAESSRKRRILPPPPTNAEIDLEEQETRNFARGTNYYKLFLIFFVGSFAGVMVELLWCLVTRGYLESRSGLVYGPFNILYGAGAVLLTVTLYRVRNRGRWLSFLGSMLVGSALEYFCSWGQELVLGSRSWDYSNMPFNLNGRICLLYSIFWGILGVLWIKKIYPRMAQWILRIPNRIGKIITWVLTGFMVFNMVVSGCAMARWAQRVHGVEATTRFAQFMDERFPDERMERIYANMEFQ